MEELIQAVNVSKNKVSDVDPDSAATNREKALLLEIKEKSEAIDVQAWIVNDQAGIMTINDLNISLPLNVPYDLSNISAKRISMSKDLKGLLKSGFVKFISPEEREEYVSKAVGEATRTSSLEVFDSPDEAEAAIGRLGDDLIDNDDDEEVDNRSIKERRPVISSNSMEITEADLAETEEESMVMNLTQNLPTVKTRPVAVEGNRRTTHDNVDVRPRPQQTQNRPSNPNIKPIRKLD
jgi:hypothetical protein